MPTEPSALERALKLIRGSRYMVLATASGVGPWAATINYVVSSGGQLLYYSSPAARHSRDIGVTSVIAAAIYSVGPDGDADGLQLTGQCKVITSSSAIDDAHQQYYLRNFADPDIRSEWLIDRSQFDEGGTHRFYTVDIEECWVIDIEQWPLSKVDLRLAIPVEELVKELKAD